jgi:hypothetical protein
MLGGIGKEEEEEGDIFLIDDSQLLNIMLQRRQKSC